jgi:hypothetical protein
VRYRARLGSVWRGTAGGFEVRHVPLISSQVQPGDDVTGGDEGFGRLSWAEGAGAGPVAAVRRPASEAVNAQFEELRRGQPVDGRDDGCSAAVVGDQVEEA